MAAANAASQQTQENEKKLSICLNSANGSLQGCKYNAKTRLVKDLRSCSSLAAGFSGTLVLSSGPISISVEGSVQPYVNQCNLVAQPTEEANTANCTYMHALAENNCLAAWE